MSASRIPYGVGALQRWGADCITTLTIMRPGSTACVRKEFTPARDDSEALQRPLMPILPFALNGFLATGVSIGLGHRADANPVARELAPAGPVRRLGRSSPWNRRRGGSG